MRSLHADLIAAQKQPSRSPVLSVILENKVASVHRDDYTTLDTTANGNGIHDVAVDGNDNVHRVWMNAGNVKYDRVTDPTNGPWSNWTNLVTGMGSVCAVAAKGSRVLVIYTNAAGTGVRYKESTDYGATFGADTLLLTAVAAVVDMSVAYKSSGGDCLITWCTATNVYINRRIAGAFGGSVTWTAGASVNAVHGVAVTYVFDYEMVVTGTTVTTLKPTLWTLIYGDGVNAVSGTWTNLSPQFQADNGSLVTFTHPCVRYTDAYRMTFVDNAAYTGGVARAYRSSLHPFASYISGNFTWRTPTPTDETISGTGIAFACTVATVNGYTYESGNKFVRRARRDQVEENVTADVLAFDFFESLDDGHGWIDLQNDAGQYTLAPIANPIGALVKISLGYYTVSGDRTSRLTDYWIYAQEHRRTGGVSTLRLYIENGHRLLRKNKQRTSIVYTSSSYRATASAIISRAGLSMSTNGASARSSAITPAWNIASDTDGETALRAVLANVADRVRMGVDGDVRFTEPLPGDSSVYTYGDAPEHLVKAMALRVELPPITEARAFGTAAYGEAIDMPYAEQGLGPPGEIRNLHSTTGAQAAATAVAHLRQRAMHTEHGSLTVQPNVGQELLDVITFADGFVHPLSQNKRVTRIQWRYEQTRPGTKFEQVLTVGDV